MNYDFTLNPNGTVRSATWEVKPYQESKKYFFTDDDGDGIYTHTPNGDKQLTGTCQFSVYQLSKCGARAKINRWMKENGYADEEV